MFFAGDFRGPGFLSWPSFPQFLASPLRSKRSKIIPKSYHGLVWCSDIFVLYIGTARMKLLSWTLVKVSSFF